MTKQCTTCHFACACREERFKALLEDTLLAHKTPDNGNYNWCDEDPCAWCIEASDLLYGGRATQPEPESHVCTFHRAMNGTCFVCGSIDEEMGASLNPPQ